MRCPHCNETFKPGALVETAEKHQIGSRRQTLVQWSQEYKMEPSTVRGRMARGMSLGEALTKPVRKMK